MNEEDRIKSMIRHCAAMKFNADFARAAVKLCWPEVTDDQFIEHCECIARDSRLKDIAMGTRLVTTNT